MINQIYQIIRVTELDGMILMFFLLLIMQSLFTLKEGKRFWLYVGVGLLLFWALYYPTRFMFPAFLFEGRSTIPRHPYWFRLACTAVTAITLSHCFLKGSLISKCVYMLFYTCFVQLYKVVWMPLYASESQLSPALFEALDVFSSLLLYVLIYLFFLLCRRVRLADSLPVSSKYLLALYLPAFLLIYYGIRFSGAAYLEEYAESCLAAIILLSIPLLYYLLVSLFNALHKQKLMDRALTRARSQAERYRLLAKVEDELKIERHELKNRYFYIYSLLMQKDYERMKTYLEDEIGRRMEMITTVSTGNALIDHLLSVKIRQAQEEGIRVNCEILLPAGLSFDEDAFCTVFLNLFDNAREACEELSAPAISLDLKVVKAYLRCEIINTAEPDRILQNPEMITTKSDPQNHGVGLRIVKKTLRESNGMLQSCLDGQTFRTVFMLPLQAEISPP